MSAYTIEKSEDGRVTGHDGRVNFRARLDLWLIRTAWDKGCDFEDLADGFGPGHGTFGDWSAIRDSSEDATRLMLARAMGFVEQLS